MSSRRYYCEHCNQYLSKTLFFKHKRLYYDRLSKKWLSTPVQYSPLEAERVSGNAFSLAGHSESLLEDSEDTFELEGLLEGMHHWSCTWTDVIYLDEMTLEEEDSSSSQTHDVNMVSKHCVFVLYY